MFNLTTECALPPRVLLSDAGGSMSTRPDSPFASIEEAIDTIRQGRMVVVVDDEDRENEGDLTLAAEHVTPEAIAFMATYGRGLICAALEGALLHRHQRPGSFPHHPGPHRPGRQAPAFRETGPRVPPPGPSRRRAHPHGADRGQRGSGAAGGPPPQWRDLRDHEG